MVTIFHVLKRTGRDNSAGKGLQSAGGAGENDQKFTRNIGGGRGRYADARSGICIWCTLLQIARPPIVEAMLEMYQSVI